MHSFCARTLYRLRFALTNENKIEHVNYLSPSQSPHCGALILCLASLVVPHRIELHSMRPPLHCNNSIIRYEFESIVGQLVGCNRVCFSGNEGNYCEKSNSSGMECGLWPSHSFIELKWSTASLCEWGTNKYCRKWIFPNSICKSTRPANSIIWKRIFVSFKSLVRWLWNPILLPPYLNTDAWRDFCHFSFPGRNSWGLHHMKYVQYSPTPVLYSRHMSITIDISGLVTRW